MAQADLTFINSYTIDAFKNKTNSTEITVHPAKSDDKYPFFLTNSGEIGTLSPNADLTDKDNLMISWVTRGDGEYWMMHKKPERETIAIF